MRTKNQRKRLLKSRSDKLLTTLRKIENQKSFLNEESGDNYITLPFNKEKKDKKDKRMPFGNIMNNFKKNVFMNEFISDSLNMSNKENSSTINIKKDSLPEIEKTSKTSKTSENPKTQNIQKKSSKIFVNDIFDIGIINEIQARETFMLDTILRSAIINR